MPSEFLLFLAIRITDTQNQNQLFHCYNQEIILFRQKHFLQVLSHEQELKKLPYLSHHINNL